MISSKEIKFLVLFFIILMAVGLFLHWRGLTFQVVDQIYCRNYYPWKAFDPGLDCSQYRSGDDIFENDFTASELDYLKDNPYQQSYSERMMNGYPIANAYIASRYSLLRFFNNFLSNTSSSTFTTLILIFTGFTVGYLIARTLDFSSWYAVIFGFFSITPAYVSLSEFFNEALIGFGLITLGLLQLYKYNRKYFFIFLVFSGSILILNSAIYQFYLYAAVSLLLLGLVYFSCDNKKRFLSLWIATGVIFMASAMILNFFLESHASFLLSSNKINNGLSLSEFIKRKDYNMDPLGWIGLEPMKAHRKFVALIFGDKFGYETFGGLTAGTFSPGVVYLTFFFLGAAVLFKKYKGYIMIVIFWLLYFSGYIQFILSLIPGPFRSETSIRGSNLFFLFSIFGVIYALRGLFSGSMVLGRKGRLIIYLIFAYIIAISSALIVYRQQKYDQFLIEAFYTVISSSAFILGFYFINSRQKLESKKNLSIILILISLILPNLSRLFLGAPVKALELHSNSLYFPKTAFQKEIEKYSDINQVAVIKTPGGEETHFNGPIYLGLNGITGARNPVYKNYTELYQYHRFVFEGYKNPSQSLVDLKKSVAYLDVASPALMASNYEIKISEATRRYFKMLGVNSIIGSENLLIQDKDWERVMGANGLSLWKRKINSPQLFFVDKIEILVDDLTRLEYIFNDKNWDPAKSAVLKNKPNLLIDGSLNKNKSKFEILKKTDGYRSIKAETEKNGILTLPVTYDKHWQAIWRNDNELQYLEIIESNYALLGVIVPAGKADIEIIYNDKSRTINKVISIAGLFMLAAVGLFLRYFL